MQTRMTGLDALDRRIVAELQQDGRASWTDVADACETSLTTVVRRGNRLMAEGFVRVAVVPSLQHTGPADLFLIHLTCAPGTQVSVAEKLTRRDDVRLVALVTGPFDIVAELLVRRDDSLSSRIVGELLAIEGVERCETDLMLHTYKVSHDWSRQLLTGERHIADVEDPHECHPSHFDDSDRAILEYLRTDGRASFRSVGQELGVNESTVRRRFETLRERGCVMVVTLVPAPSLGFESEIILEISVRPSRLDAVATEVAAHLGVRYVASTLRSSSLLCEVILPSTRSVFDFLTTVVGQLEGVTNWAASMEILTLKRGFVETPWWHRALRPYRDAIDGHRVDAAGLMATADPLPGDQVP
jgi:DNA-binding Lrp family transcriptional regulator